MVYEKIINFDFIQSNNNLLQIENNLPILSQNTLNKQKMRQNFIVNTIF